MRVCYHVYSNYTVATGGRSDEEIAAAGGPEADRIRQLRYSFVCSAYHARRRKFFRFNPYTLKFEFPGTAFPNALASANIKYPGAGPVDCMINGGDGHLPGEETRQVKRLQFCVDGK